MARERTIQTAILRYLNGLEGCKAINQPGGRLEVGTPDIIGCYRGKFFAMEVKRPGEKPRPIQEKRLREWSGAGGSASTVHSVEEAQEVIQNLI